MSYTHLLPLIKKSGSPLTPEGFHEKINVIFHDHEADHYDVMHNNMWQSLQEQIDLLVGDLFDSGVEVGQKLSLLDIGCGTGLSSQILINSKLGSHIEKVTLLDTSANMLKQAELKARQWNKEYKIINSQVSGLTEQFDVVIICSVLHHIPELEQFLKQLDSIVKPGGILIHLQDPNGDYLRDPKYLKRVEEYKVEVRPDKKRNSVTNLIPKRWKNYINNSIGKKTYIDLINDQLIAQKAISKRMTAEEIWSVTDIHVENKSNKLNKGISLGFLAAQLGNFKLISQRSYAFYGFLKSDLNDKFKQKEDELIAQKQLNGRNISCLRIKK